MNWTLIIIGEDVIHSHLVFFYVFRIIRITRPNVIRKLFFYESRIHDFSRFDGNSVKVESSSNYPHRNVRSLGVYNGAPFVTGSYSPSNKKTEILDYSSKQWNLVADYPFGSEERFV